MLPNYNEIVDLLKKGSTLEVQEKILELRAATLNLQEENLALRQKVNSLESQLKDNETLNYEAPFYWRKSEGKKDGPFCQQCYDNKDKKIRLQSSDNDYWNCSTCGTGYPGPKYRDIDVSFETNNGGW